MREVWEYAPGNFPIRDSKNGVSHISKLQFRESNHGNWHWVFGKLKYCWLQVNLKWLIICFVSENFKKTAYQQVKVFLRGFGPNFQVRLLNLSSTFTGFDVWGHCVTVNGVQKWYWTLTISSVQHHFLILVLKPVRNFAYSLGSFVLCFHFHVLIQLCHLAVFKLLATCTPP